MSGPPLPTSRSAAVGRRISQGIFRPLWRIRGEGVDLIPVSGPVLLAGNHANFIDGPMLLGVVPRPVHFLVKQEMFRGPLGAILRGVGQIPVDRARTDRTAVQTALGVLRAGGVLGVFPEGTRSQGEFSSVQNGLAYFALRSGAPVVPVACLGTGDRGTTLKTLPRPRTRIDVVFGAPIKLEPAGSSSPRKALEQASEQLRVQLAAHVAAARARTGRAGTTAPDHEERPDGT